MRQVINVGSYPNDPTAEHVQSAFTKVNSMFQELGTAYGVSVQTISLSGTPDTIRGAFQKYNTNVATLYAAGGLGTAPTVNAGSYSDDPGAQSIRDAFGQVNAATQVLYDNVVVGDYYVAPTGNNNAAGDIDHPFQTIAHGLSLLSAGQVLVIRGGTYLEALSSGSVPSGSVSSYTRVSAYPGETVIVRPSSVSYVLNLMGQSYIQFDRLVFDGTNISNSGANISSASHHIRFVECEMKNGPLSGFYVSATGHSHEWIRCLVHDNGTSELDHNIYQQADNCIVDGGEFYNTTGYGIQLYTGAAGESVNGCVVKNVRFHNCAKGGITIFNANNNLVYNCLSYSNGMGISSGGTATGNKVFHNTVNGNTGSGIVLNSGFSSNQIRNNIVYNNGQNFQTINANNTVTNNLCNSGCAVNGNPLFVAPTATPPDFHLQAGSPAIGQGTPLTLTDAPLDADGMTRQNPPDIGAYQH